MAPTCNASMRCSWWTVLVLATALQLVLLHGGTHRDSGSLAAALSIDIGTPQRTYCSTSGSDFFVTESIDEEAMTRTITTNSCPNHYSVCQEPECSGADATYAAHHDRSFTVPLFPHMASIPTDVTCSAGAVGVAVNGVQIYSQYDDGINADSGANGALHTHFCARAGRVGQHVRGNSCPIDGLDDGTKYCGDSVARFGNTFDVCGGHADRQDGVYHYHTLPVCLLNQLLDRRANETWVQAQEAEAEAEAAEGDSVNGRTGTLSRPPTPAAVDSAAASAALQHSPQVGWALDGFPIYGPRGIGGLLMRPCPKVGSSGSAHPATTAEARGIAAHNIVANQRAELPNHANFSGGGMGDADGDAPEHPQFCLDQCNGYYGALPHVDSYMYRYYVSGGGSDDVAMDGSGGLLPDAGGDGNFREYSSNPFHNDAITTRTQLYGTLMDNSNIGSNQLQREDCATYTVNSGSCRRMNMPNVTYTATPASLPGMLSQRPPFTADTEACCMAAVPARTYAPYTIGCLRGCTLADHAAGLCAFSDTARRTMPYGEVHTASSKGTLDNFRPRRTPLVQSVYQRKLSTPYPPDTVPAPAPVMPAPAPSNFTNIISEITSRSSTVFRYANNGSLAILHSTTTLRSTVVAAPYDAATVLPGSARSTILTPAVTTPRQPTLDAQAAAYANTSTLEYTSSSCSTEDLPVNRAADRFIASMASTQHSYQQVLTAFQSSAVAEAEKASTSARVTSTAVHAVEQRRKELFFETHNRNSLHHRLFYATVGGGGDGGGGCVYSIPLSGNDDDEVAHAAVKGDVSARPKSSGEGRLDASKHVRSVLSGILTVTLRGHNLGQQLSDIHYVSVRDHKCTSIVWFSDKKVQCSITAMAQDSLATLTDDDVVFSAKTGEMRGIYLQPKVLLQTFNLRPIVTSITFGDTSSAAFSPHTVAISPTFSIVNYNLTAKVAPPLLLESSKNLRNVVAGHVYVSLLASASVVSSGAVEADNEAAVAFYDGLRSSKLPDATPARAGSKGAAVTSGGQIIRSDFHGNAVRVLVRNVPKVYGIAVYQPLLSVTEDELATGKGAAAIPPVAPDFEAHTDTTGGVPEAPHYILRNASYRPRLKAFPTTTTTTDNATVRSEVVFFIEATSATLVAALVPISDEDFGPETHVGIDGSQAEVLVRNSEGGEVQPWSLITVIENLHEPRGLTVDHGTGGPETARLFVTLVDGTVLQVDAVWAAAKLVGTPLVSSAPTPLALPDSTGGSAPGSSRRFSVRNADIPMSYRGYVSVLVSRGRSSSRLAGVSAAPLLYSTANSMPWKQERVFAADPNMQQLLLVSAPRDASAAVDSSSGTGKKPLISNAAAAPTPLDMTFTGFGHKGTIVWPTAIIALVDTAPTRTSTGAEGSGSGAGTEGRNTAMSASSGVQSTDTINYSLYVSEYLGKIWKLTLTRVNENTVTKGSSTENSVRMKRSRYVIAKAPELLLDLSHFAASIRLRQLLAASGGINTALHANSNSASSAAGNAGVTRSGGSVTSNSDLYNSGSSSITNMVGNYNLNPPQQLSVLEQETTVLGSNPAANGVDISDTNTTLSADALTGGRSAAQKRRGGGKDVVYFDVVE